VDLAFRTCWERAASSLAEETGLPFAAGGFKGVTLEVNVHPREQVAAATESAAHLPGKGPRGYAEADHEAIAPFGRPYGLKIDSAGATPA